MKGEISSLGQFTAPSRMLSGSGGVPTSIRCIGQVRGGGVLTLSELRWKPVVLPLSRLEQKKLFVFQGSSSTLTS